MKKEDIYEALKQLGNLREQGILTEEEFAKEKSVFLKMLKSEFVSSSDSSDTTENETMHQSSQSTISESLDIFATGGFLTTTSNKNDPTNLLETNEEINATEAMDFFMTGGTSPHSEDKKIDIANSSIDGESDEVLGSDFFLTGGDSPPNEAIERETEILLAERYEVIEELGRGGMGQVLKAFDRQTQEMVAIKTLYQSDDTALTRQLFLQELTLHERLNHENIIKIRTLEKDPHLGFFFTMDFFEGEDLGKLLERAKQSHKIPPFSLTKSLDFIEEIVSALSHAHVQGVLHLDLKPANILVVNNHIKLIDFGIAKLRSQGGDRQITGTVYYMPPEQLNQKAHLDVSADVYSLGVIVYQILTGELFQGGMPGPSQLNPELPEEVDLVHAKAVSWLPEDRFQDVNLFLSSLKKALRSKKKKTYIHQEKQTNNLERKNKKKGKKTLHHLTEKQQNIGLVNWPQILENIDKKRPLWLETPMSRKAPNLIVATQLESEAILHLPYEPLSKYSLILMSRNDEPLVEFIPISGGQFSVGADKKNREARRFEKPKKIIQLSTFWIARSPISNKMWQIFLDESNYEPDGKDKHPDYLASWKKEGEQWLYDHYEHAPVSFLSLSHVWAFCDFYGLSLPTEAQWEVAAQHKDGFPFLKVLAQFNDTKNNQNKRIPHSKVGSFDNIRQWIADEFDARWLRQIKGENFVIQGVDRSRFYSVRGLSFHQSDNEIKPFHRDNENADACLDDLGFRPSLDLNLTM